jgi:hypothetical protein
MTTPFIIVNDRKLRGDPKCSLCSTPIKKDGSYVRELQTRNVYCCTGHLVPYILEHVAGVLDQHIRGLEDQLHKRIAIDKAVQKVEIEITERPPDP